METASERQRRWRRIASLILEQRLASPAQVARALSECEEGRAADPASWLEGERILSSVAREALEERLARAAAPAAEEGQDTVVDGQAPVRDAAEELGLTADGHAGHRTRTRRESREVESSGGEVGGDLLAVEAPGRYTFLKVHATGGQAHVLLCQDEHIGREVAIKEIHPADGDGPEASHRSTSVEAQRLLREARVTGQLEHPNIVPVYDLGKRKDGALYYSMRFVRGTTLSQKLKACRSLQERVRLLRPFMDICSAVAYAHSRGVIHRDLKPSNVMVGEFGETVLLDWGIAKVRGRQDIRAVDVANESKLLAQYEAAETMAGAAIGTPAYMSPEQAAGRVDEIDERSDVWGLGAILYQILTGNPPNTGKTQAELMTAILERSIKPVLSACPEAPPELAAICEKALRKEKVRRYKTAKELADEVEAYLTGGRVRAYRYSSWELLRRFAEQNKKTMIAAAAGLALIVGALVVVTLALGRESAARAVARREGTLARFNLAEARAKEADRQRDDFRFASAEGKAAESLLNNPAHPKSPFYAPAFAAESAEARQLVVRAASTVYQSRRHSVADLVASFEADEVLTQAAYSPDGRRVVVGSYDGKVRIWSPAGRSLERVLDGHGGERVYTVGWSPDGRLVASGGRDRRIVLWDAATGAKVRVLEGHEGVVRHLAFSPDGRTLASASWDRTVRVWDVAGGKPLVLLRHDDQVLVCAWSADGRLLASGGLDRLVRIWEGPRFEPMTTIAAFTTEVKALAFSPDGRALAAGSRDRSIRVFHPESGKPLQNLETTQGAGGIEALTYSPDGRFLVSSGFDRTVRLWDARGGSPLATIEAHDDIAVGVAFSPDGETLASAGYDRRLKIWRMRRGDALGLSGHTAYVYGVAFSTSGRLLATGAADKTVRLWEASTGRPMAVLSGHNNVVLHLAFNPDSTLLASAARERTAIVWDVKEGRALYKIETPLEIYDVAFSPDGSVLATAGADKAVRLFDAARGRPLRVLEGHEAPLSCVAFSPDGNLVASGGQDKTIRLWSREAGGPVAVLKGHTDWVWSLDFHPDGTRLLSTGKDGQVILWDVATGRELRRFAGHRQWVDIGRFSPAGELIITGSDDQTARIWDVETGEPRLILHATREVVGADFSPDGRTIAMADGNTVRVYPLEFSMLEADPQLLLEEAQAAGYRGEEREAK